MKKSTKKPWMPAAAYSKSMQGFSINLIVSDIDNALRFQKEVLGAEIVYEDEDFAVLQGYGGEWMLHVDHTYDGHPLLAMLGDDVQRGAGVELRLHGCDPDSATEKAKDLGFHILAPPKDKPHGMREAYILDSDGYIWVPDRPL
jgi:catechol 2,3-dioxygenase-like lactoylglutathione lyase family enzyme